MSNYTIYNANGDITSVFVGTPENLLLNIPEGHSYISGEYNAMEYKIVADQPVLKTEADKITPSNEAWVNYRNERGILLAVSDWTQMADSPLSTVEKEAWQTYRQSLRDLPENTVDPLNPIWPSIPA
tara:strand:+ start:247 stop:627 length:381 start_codon:yes stop_codon:yes gene_type:complete